MKKLLAIIGISFLFLPAGAAYAQPSYTSVTDRAGSAVYGSENQVPVFAEVLGRLLQVLLSILGLVLLGYLIVGGMFYFSAGGNEDRVKKAKAMLRNSIIGIILVSASLVIANFVTQSIESATSSAPVEETATQ